MPSFSSMDGYEAIAIVGIGLRFPGQATSQRKLWEMLVNKRSALSCTPSDRFNVDAFWHPNADKNGTMNSRKAHFLEEDMAAFDAPFFSISPADAMSMDPMQRKLLEVAYEATEDAGMPIEQLSGTDVNASCFVGCFTSDYEEFQKKDPETGPKYASIGSGRAMLSNRISWCFDMRGPSMTLDTACSSSLIALHLGCQSLRTGESKIAVIGGAAAILSPDVQISMTNLHFLSPDSKSHSFDSRANGYARGEGIAALVIKPLPDAIRDGDVIRAVIRGSAANSDGQTPGITVPSSEAHVSLMRKAYDVAGCDPRLTAYFEAHGTGTAAGDPIEARAIGEALGKSRDDNLYIGSVKTNIGHLEGAAGLAGVIKAILSLEHGVIAPNLWFENGNPAIDFEAWRLKVPTEPVLWPRPGLRRVSVNSFGYGGANAHVILDDAYHYLQERGLKGRHRTQLLHPSPTVANAVELLKHKANPGASTPPDANVDSQSSEAATSSGTDTPPSSVDGDVLSGVDGRPRLFFLSGHETEVVKQAALDLSKDLKHTHTAGDSCFLDDLAFTLLERRSRHKYGLPLVAASRKELIAQLETPGAPILKAAKPPRLSLVFTGQGAQWWGQGRELMDYPRFAATIAQCDVAVKKWATWSLQEELLRDEDESRIQTALFSQPLCTALQIALVDLLDSWGVTPSSVVGHSSGEIAAAYAIGALSLDAAMQVAYFRGTLSSLIPSKGFLGGMLAAGLSEEAALSELASLGKDVARVGIACINSPQSVTLSGDSVVLDQLQQTLTARGIFARRLLVDTAYHSHHMSAIAKDYQAALDDLAILPVAQWKDITMFSSVTGEELTAADMSSEYWIRNMVGTVRFSNALLRLVGDDGPRKRSRKAPDLVIELGPHGALAGPVRQILTTGNQRRPRPISYISMLSRGKNAAVTSLELAGTLLAQGCPLDVRALQPFAKSSDLSMVGGLPSYPWNRSRTYWVESRLTRDYLFRKFPRTDILGAPFWDWNPTEPRWRNFVRLPEQPWIRSHVVQGTVAYPAAGFCCMAFEAARQIQTIRGHAQPSRIALKDVSISRALIVPDTDDGVEVVFTMRPQPLSSISSSESVQEFRIFSYTAAAGWNEHCRGLVDSASSSTPVLDTGFGMSIDQDTSGPLSAADPAKLYAALHGAGLQYGEDFQGIQQITMGTDMCSGTVEIADTRKTMPCQFEFDHILHPTTLDNLFQMSILALCDGNMANISRPFVPTFIESMTVSGSVASSHGALLNVTARGQRRGSRKAIADISADGLGDLQIGIEIKGLECVALSGAVGSSDSERDITKLGARAIWNADLDMLSQEEMHRLLRTTVVENQPQVSDRELVAWYYVERALNEVKPTECGNMAIHHQKVYHFLQRQQALVLAGKHEQQTQAWTSLDHPEVQTRIAHLRASFSDETKMDFDGRMIVRIGEALPAILRQEVDPLSLMMEGGFLYEYYTLSLGAYLIYPQIAKYIDLLSHKNPSLEYLEIGAGTGGLSASILQALRSYDAHGPARMKSYTYTDISTGFFPQAQQKFAEWGRNMVFKKLDVEQDPETQGFSLGQYDVIIAANVLHATFDMSRTLKNVRKLLKPGGQLLLLEMTHPLLTSSLPFGTLPGWWNCKEDWRPDGPLLTESQWQTTLAETGFSEPIISTPDREDPVNEASRFMVSVAKAGEQRAAGLPSRAVNGKIVFIVSETATQEQDELCSNIGSQLQRSPERSTLLEMINMDLRGVVCISLLGLEGDIFANIEASEYAAFQHVTAQSAGLIYLTYGLHEGSGPEAAIIHGLARSIRTEQHDFPCITIDFSKLNKVGMTEMSRIIANVFNSSFDPRQAETSKDQEFVVKDGHLHVKRVIEDTEFSELVAARAKDTLLRAVLRDLSQETEKLRLTSEYRNSVNSLVWAEDSWSSEAVKPDEVEIRVHAFGGAGLATGRAGSLEDDTLGQECAGVVVSVGSSVTSLAEGDRVVSWNIDGKAATHVRAPQFSVCQIPGPMSYATAAAIPRAYVTAYTALVRIAKLSGDETVLVDGSVIPQTRQAAVRVAQWMGTKVLVVVDSEEQRQDVIASGVYAECVLVRGTKPLETFIRSKTADHGVDILLTGEVSIEALDTALGCVAPFGRCVELATPSSDRNARRRTKPSTGGVAVVTLDVEELHRQHPETIHRMLVDIIGLFAEGLLQQPQIITSPLSSLHSIADGQSTSTSILTVQPGDMVPIVPKPPAAASFRPDATYILAGGLGGLGRSMSRWMVRNGARHLAFLSRSGASSSVALELISELQGQGVQAVALACDISDERSVNAATIQIKNSLPPISGVFHNAMVLQDSLFANMSHESFAKALRPKVAGSWNLHKATLDSRLDFFVMLSSLAGLMGTAGQSNYVAGCNYQVALARHRRSLGLPASSVDVGYVSDVGYIAENATAAVQQNFSNLGIGDIKEAELLAILEIAINDQRLANECHGHLITGLYGNGDRNTLLGEGALPSSAGHAMFSHLEIFRPYLHQASSETANAQDSGQIPLQSLLSSAKSPAEAQAVVAEALRRKAARLLMMPVEDCDPSLPLGSYGIDSLVAIEIRNWILREARADVSIFDILNAASLRGLADTVVEKLTLSQKEGGS